jgi:hypothetical protein
MAPCCWYVLHCTVAALSAMFASRVETGKSIGKNSHVPFSGTHPIVSLHYWLATPTIASNSWHHRSPITISANVFIVLSFICSVGNPANPWGFPFGLIALLIVLFTSCCRIHQWVLYLATVSALICWVSVVLEASNLYCNPDDTDSECRKTQALRKLSTAASVFWIISVGLIFFIPTTPLASAGGISIESHQEEGEIEAP